MPILQNASPEEFALQPPLDVNEIMSLLPHRYPFLLIDIMAQDWPFGAALTTLLLIGLVLGLVGYRRWEPEA